jgi:hypothetical protein
MPALQEVLRRDCGGGLDNCAAHVHAAPTFRSLRLLQYLVCYASLSGPDMAPRSGRF